MIWPQSRFVRYAVIPILVIWLIWFGLSKYFLYQSLKQYPIANPIPAVPLSDPYYRLKHEAGIKENVGRAATRQNAQESNERDKNPNLPLYGSISLQNFSKQSLLNELREAIFYRKTPLFDGGSWLVESPTDPIRQGLQYCRIPYAHDDYGMGSDDRIKSRHPIRDPDPNDQYQYFYHFEKGQEPCIQHENLIVNWGGSGQIGFLGFPKRDQPPEEYRSYITFPGYIYGHTNNFDDYKEYVYLCSRLKGEKISNCKLLGYDQEMEKFYQNRPFAKGHENDYYRQLYPDGKLK